MAENRRVSGRRMVQRQVLYLGELKDNQRAGWVRTIGAVSDKEPPTRTTGIIPG
ncbi:MAG TPA: hypothetical protein PLA96_08180 [Candidatus Brocadia sapporoensis]|nr:hypothetical protein [Candidatus Brocadia sp.]HQU31452.1 hypothetical protein [Candidatus Brocadia sapporoensis]